MLAELGADVHTQAASGATALHCAAKKGQVEALKVLVELGVDVSSVNNRGSSALRLASHNGHRTVVRFLAEHIADLAAASSIAPAERATQNASGAAAEEDELPPPEARPSRRRPPRACAHCGASEAAEAARLQWCRGCLCVRYCNSTCQRRHWKADHREQCSGRRVPRQGECALEQA